MQTDSKKPQLTKTQYDLVCQRAKKLWQQKLALEKEKQDLSSELNRIKEKYHPDYRYYYELVCQKTNKLWNDNQNLSAQLKASESVQEQTTQLHFEMDNLSRQLESKECELREVSAELQKKENDIQLLNLDREKIFKKHERMTNAQMRLLKENDRLLERNIALKKQLARVASEREQREVTRQQTLMENESLKEQLKKSQIALAKARLTNKLTNEKESNDQISAHMALLKSEKSTFTKEIRRIEKQLDLETAHLRRYVALMIRQQKTPLNADFSMRVLTKGSEQSLWTREEQNLAVA